MIFCALASLLLASPPAEIAATIAAERGSCDVHGQARRTLRAARDDAGYAEPDRVRLRDLRFLVARARRQRRRQAAHRGGAGEALHAALVKWILENLGGRS